MTEAEELQKVEQCNPNAPHFSDEWPSGQPVKAAQPRARNTDDRTANDPRRCGGVRQSMSFGLSSSASLPAALFGLGAAQSSY